MSVPSFFDLLPDLNSRVAALTSHCNLTFQQPPPESKKARRTAIWVLAIRPRSPFKFLSRLTGKPSNQKKVISRRLILKRILLRKRWLRPFTGTLARAMPQTDLLFSRIRSGKPRDTRDRHKATGSTWRLSIGFPTWRAGTRSSRGQIWGVLWAGRFG